MKQQSESIVEAWRLLQRKGIKLPDFVKALTEFDLLYQTSDGYKRMPVGNETATCVAVGFFPFNYASFSPINVPYNAFLLFDEQVVEDIKLVNSRYVPKSDIWSGVMVNKDHINAFLNKLNQLPLNGVYLAYVRELKDEVWFSECELKSAGGCERLSSITRRGKYPTGKGGVKYRIGGVLEDGKIYTALDNLKEEMVLPKIKQKIQLDFPFDLLCIVNGKKVRLPYCEGKDKNPFGIFPLRISAYYRYYLELEEHPEDIRRNADESKFPEDGFCQQVWKIREALNCCLQSLNAPPLKGCYYAKKGNYNWIVGFDAFENEQCMPSDYYNFDEKAKIRYCDIF